VERVLPEESGKVFASGKWGQVCNLLRKSGGRFLTCPGKVGAGF
jgi:hypothetical protein